jgi:hypothetical protein
MPSPCSAPPTFPSAASCWKCSHWVTSDEARAARDQKPCAAGISAPTGAAAEQDFGGAPWDTVAIKQVDANTFTSASKKTGGTYSSTSRTEISKDGNTMTVASKGTNAEGKAFDNLMVFDKQ